MVNFYMNRSFLLMNGISLQKFEGLPPRLSHFQWLY
jgi:hypothetical protein